jgi:hypothetical protein
MRCQCQANFANGHFLLIPRISIEKAYMAQQSVDSKEIHWPKSRVNGEEEEMPMRNSK